MNGIYWIENDAARLAIVSRPRGGYWLRDDLAALQKAGMHVLVSLLGPEEVGDLELDEEAAIAAELGMRFISHPLPDHQTPVDQASFDRLIEQLAELARSGNSIGVHCWGSIGRSGIVMASLMTALGVELRHALRVIEKARGCPVPETLEQKNWLLDSQPHA